jgi:hypothetical protein
MDVTNEVHLEIKTEKEVYIDVSSLECRAIQNIKQLIYPLKMWPSSKI